MAITTFVEEATRTDYWSRLNTILHRLWSIYDTTWLDSPLCNYPSLPPLPPEVDDECHTDEFKGNFEERKHLQKGAFRKCMKTLLSKIQCSNAVSRILSALKRFWPIALLILMLLPHQVTAFELDRDCTLWHGERNDATLDVNDVKAFLSERGLFNVSSMSYDKICPDSFAYAPVGRIILSFNNVPSLPVNLFRGIDNLEEVELQGNPLSELPSVLNSTKTVRFLNLADTKIGHIPKHSINGMTGLMVLDLSRTELTDVPEDIFDMSLRLVHLSQTKLDRLPLPPPTSVAFNVTLVGTHCTELSISYPDSEKRKIGINITGIETLTCENAKTAVESSYCVLAGEIECDHGSFRKINILLKGKTGFPPSCTRKQNANTNTTVTANVVSNVSPNTPVPNWGAATPSSNSCKKTVSLHLVIGGSLVMGMIIGAFFVGVIVILFRRKLLSFNKSEDVALQ